MTMVMVVSDRTKNVLTALAMAPFCGASLFFFIIASFHLLTLRRIAAHVPSASSFGPVRLSGEISRPRGPARAPSGATAAGWAAWIGSEGTDATGRHRFSILCSRADLSDLKLPAYPGLGPIDLARPGDPIDVTFGNRLKLTFPSTSLIVHLGTLADGLGGASPKIPQEMLVSCEPELVGANRATFLYTEHLLEEAHAVEILACRRDGRVIPCKDGVDAITTQKINLGQRSFSAILFIGQAWTLAFVATLGFAAAARVVRVRKGSR